VEKVSSLFIMSKYIIVLIIVTVFISLSAAQEHNIFKVKRRLSRRAEKFGQKNFVRYTVINKGNPIYSIRLELDYDLPFPELKVFDDGAAVLVNSFDGSLSFYNRQGLKTARSYIQKEIAVRYERSVYAAVSGAILAVTLSQPDMKYTLVRLYTKKGQPISRWRVPEKLVSGLCYSDQNQLLAVAVYGWSGDRLNKFTLFFNEKGRKISQIPYGYKNGKFFRNGRLFIAYSNKICFVYNVKENKINFRYLVPKNAIITGAEYLNETVTIMHTPKPFLEKGKWYYQSPSFTRLNLKGEVIKEWQERGKLFSR